MKTNRLFLSLIFAGALTYANMASADVPNTPSITVDPAEKARIESVLHDYLLKNPEIIVQAVQVLQEKQLASTQKSIQKTQQNAPKFVEALFHQSSDPVAGNPRGNVTIVEFFDYQCPHCIDMTPVLDNLIKSNPHLRVVFKEFPIRGAMSDMASAAALAANVQGRYFQFHKALMQKMKKGDHLTEDTINQAAQSVGLNMGKFKADMKSTIIQQQVKANYKLAQDLGLIGTPAFFIAQTGVSTNSPPTAIDFVPGGAEQTQLQSMIDKARK